jgi:hypothetical protein
VRSASTREPGPAERELRAAQPLLMDQRVRESQVHRAPTQGPGSAVRGHVSPEPRRHRDGGALTEPTPYPLGRPKDAAAKGSGHPCSLKAIRSGLIAPYC